MRTKGLREISDALNLLPREVAGQHLREVALLGAEVIREQAEANARAIQRTGTLAGDIHAEIARESIGSRVVVHIGPGREGWYGRLVEFGHAIVRGGRLRSKSRPGTLVGHVPPHPWLRPAFDARRRVAQRIMEAEFRRRLSRIWSR